jgi:Flp pilus assembly CpaF family ATPase
MLPDGSRLHVVIPDVTRRHMAVNIRKFVLQAHSLDELVELGTLTAQVARLPRGVRRRRSQHPGVRRHPAGKPTSP